MVESTINAIDSLYSFCASLNERTAFKNLLKPNAKFSTTVIFKLNTVAIETSSPVLVELNDIRTCLATGPTLNILLVLVQVAPVPVQVPYKVLQAVLE